MYKVYCDDFPLYDPRDEDLILIDPKVTLEVNTPGSFECKIPPTHPYYDKPVKMLSRITVYQDDEIIFKGRIIKTNLDYYNRKTLSCEGELAFLNDSIQRPAEYHDMTPKEYFSKIIEIHNGQVEVDKQFEVGMVTVTNSTDNVYRYTNWENTLTTIKEDLIDSMGGYIRVRNADGHRYLDYIESYDTINQQVIEFGENLLDFTRNIDMTDIATAVVPLGNRLETSSIPALEERLTISSVNDGKDYLVNEDAVKKYGYIFKTITWDDVTTADRLKTHGEKWLKSEQFENMIIEAKAIDLHYVNDSKQPIRLGDSVRIVSKAHGLDKYFPVSKLTISLNQLSQNTLTFNGTVKTTVSARTNAISQLQTQIDELPSKSSILSDAAKHATALLTAATHGYVTLSDDSSELFIANDPDVTKATKVWRWNLNGLGYSNNGYKGDYGTAMTMDGAINGNFLTVGTITANLIKAGILQDLKGLNYWNLETGEFQLKALANYSTTDEMNTAVTNATSGLASDSDVSTALSEAKSYADSVSSSAVDGQTQETIFNKLTNGGTSQGIYLKDGILYIDASYIKAGTITGITIRSEYEKLAMVGHMVAYQRVRMTGNGLYFDMKSGSGDDEDMVESKYKLLYGVDGSGEYGLYLYNVSNPDRSLKVQTETTDLSFYE